MRFVARGSSLARSVFVIHRGQRFGGCSVTLLRGRLWPQRLRRKKASPHHSLNVSPSAGRCHLDLKIYPELNVGRKRFQELTRVTPCRSMSGPRADSHPPRGFAPRRDRRDVGHRKSLQHAMPEHAAARPASRSAGRPVARADLRNRAARWLFVNAAARGSSSVRRTLLGAIRRGMF